MWLISLIGSLGAFFAALAAWRTAIETRKTVLVQILLQITDTYSSPEMLEAMQNLRKWKEQNGPDFAKLFGQLRHQNYERIEQLDKDRRRISHYFYRIKLLLQAGLLNKNLVKELVTEKQVDFLLKIIEPLERVIDPNYDFSTYDTFKKLFNKDKVPERDISETT